MIHTNRHTTPPKHQQTTHTHTHTHTHKKKHPQTTTPAGSSPSPPSPRCGTRRTPWRSSTPTASTPPRGPSFPPLFFKKCVWVSWVPPSVRFVDAYEYFGIWGGSVQRHACTHMPCVPLFVLLLANRPCKDSQAACLSHRTRTHLLMPTPIKNSTALNPDTLHTLHTKTKQLRRRPLAAQRPGLQGRDHAPLQAKHVRFRFRCVVWLFCMAI